MRRLCAAVGTAALCLCSAPAHAATITVTNTNDSGPGSLRQAIISSNTGDTITFLVPLPATIDLTSGELLITHGLTISGPSATDLTVRRDAAVTTPFRIFNIAAPAATVTLSKMRISNGSAEEGGAILNSGSNLTVSNVVIAGNTATGSGGSAGRQGGAGIASSSGTLIVNDSTIDSNNCSSQFCLGGGIGAYLNTQSVRITGSTISNNSATYGGGIFLGEHGTASDISNSTISGNTIPVTDAGTFGTGVFLLGGTVNDVVTFTSVTLVNGPGNVGLYFNGGTPRADFRNTIVASTGANLMTSGPFSVVSHGYNLATDFSLGLTDPTDRNGVDPLVGPLVNNGGATATHALLAGSPAKDTGTCSDAMNHPIAVDQRGVARPQGSTCDIGAFEVESGIANLDVPVSTRATQTSVNDLQNSVSALQGLAGQRLDANVSSRASQSSVDNVQSGVNSLQNAAQSLDARVSSRASQLSVDALGGMVSGKLDAAVSTRATQTSVDSVQTGIGTVQSGLGNVQTGLGTVQSGLGVVQTNLGTVATQASLNQVASGVTAIFSGIGALNTRMGDVSTQVNGLGSALDAPVSTRASQASVDALASHVGDAVGSRAFIELQLMAGTRLSSLYLPAAFGGKLETVRDLVTATITANKQAGLDVKMAETILSAANAAFASGYYKIAFDVYAKAYQACVR